ncbi:unnamed protein product [Coregonus sp. 'balchen']|nr:unnamed protein product [Coregonus sp. 'balchen']
MTVEKAFGILAARWRILYKKTNLLPSKVDTLVFAMCILHNFLTKPCDVEMWLQQSGAGMRQGMRGIAIKANRAVLLWRGLPRMNETEGNVQYHHLVSLKND